MSWRLCVIGALLVPVAACRDRSEPSGTRADGGADAGLPWDQGGEDIPESSLARLIIADADAPQITLFDLDSETVAGTLPIAASTVFSGASGRYSYTHSERDGLLRVVDPGQWLLSHIDHFHVVKSELQIRAEQLQVLNLSSIASHEGWIAAVDGAGGAVSSFQERSITAMSFTPSIVSIEPHAGVALVSHAHVLASELGSDGTWGIAVRDALSPEVLEQHVSGCSAPTSIAADAEHVFVACAEGILSLGWLADEGELSASLLSPTVDGERPTRVRVYGATGHVLFDRGAHKLALASGSAISELSFDAAILQFEIRRQGTAAVVLTGDGRLHEITLPSFMLGRSAEVLPPYEGDTARAPRFALSHAYAYVADARSPAIHAFRLASWQLEDRFAVGGAPLEISMAGMPFNYTDDRE